MTELVPPLVRLGLPIALAWLTVLAPAAGYPLIATNSVWRYFKGLSEASSPTNAWRELAFDDSTWAVGSAPFHFGTNAVGGDDNLTGGTILSDMRGNYSCVYLRQTFEVIETNHLQGLQLKLWVDDSAAVWLNGRRLAVPFFTVGTTLAHNGRALLSREGTLTSLSMDVAASDLRLGTNVLSVQAFNVDPADVDFRFEADFILASSLVAFGTAAISAPETADVVTVEVRRTGQLDATTTVSWATEDQTATAAADYVASSGELRFFPGQSVQSLSVPLLNDGLTETNEQFGIRLTGASLDAAVRQPQVAIVTILDNDIGIRFATSTVHVAENAGYAVIPVRREADSLDVATVEWFTVSNGLAQAGVDYEAVSGTLTFAVGETEKSILVPIYGNPLPERPETFTVRLRQVSATSRVAPPTNVIVQIDDQPAWQNIHVWADSPSPEPPFGTWETAAHVIQDAVDAAWDGDTILVTNGVYEAGRKIVSGRGSRVALTNVVTLRSVNGPEVTTIRGEPAPDGGNGPDATACVYVGAKSTLCGFTLTNGHAYVGGGAYGEGSSRITDCVISGNQAEIGGGVAGPRDAVVEKCVITGNLANERGGGSRGPLLLNCTLARNTAVRRGGGASEAELHNCLLVGNHAGERGGGFGDFGKLHNCTVTSNTAGESSGGTFDGELYNCIVWENFAPVDPDADGALQINTCTTDPFFVDSPAGDFRLRADSPCIDAGENRPELLATDRDGFPRVLDGNADGMARVDQGAFEFYPHRLSPRPGIGPAGIELIARGAPGESINLEWSSDLNHWALLEQRLLRLDGVAVFHEAIPVEAGQRFYRVAERFLPPAAALTGHGPGGRW